MKQTRIIVKTKLIINRLQSDNLIKMAIRNLGGSTITRLFGSVLMLAQPAITARLLGPQYFGELVYIQSILLVLGVISRFGLNTASVRFIAQYKVKQDWGYLKGFLRFATWITFCCSIFLIGLAAIAAQLLSSYGLIDSTTVNLFLVGLPLILIYAFMEIQSGMLRGFGYLRMAMIPNLIIFPSGIIASLLLFYYTTSDKIDATTAILIHVAIGIFIIIFQRVYLYISLPQIVRHIQLESDHHTWWSTSTWMLVSSGTLLIIQQLDILVVGTFIGTTQAGIYSIAARITRIVVYGLQLTNFAMAPLYSEIKNNSNTRSLQRIVSFTSLIIFLSSFPLAILMLLMGDALVTSIFGMGYVESWQLVRLLMIGQIVNSLTGPNNLLLDMTGHHKDVALLFTGSLLTNIILFLLLIPSFGIYGVALAVVISQIIQNIISTMLAWIHLSINTTIFRLKLYQMQ